MSSNNGIIKESNVGPIEVIFVGSNPSEASKNILPFWGDTKSDKILHQWISRLPDDACTFVCNVLDEKTLNNKPLNMAQIKQALPNLASKVLKFKKIIALGKTATIALRALGVDFYEMPHPSGRNRKLNDKTYVEGKIKGMLEYLTHNIPKK